MPHMFSIVLQWELFSGSQEHSGENILIFFAIPNILHWCIPVPGEIPEDTKMRPANGNGEIFLLFLIVAAYGSDKTVMLYLERSHMRMRIARDAAMPKIFISTAEPSADRHASHLTASLLREVDGLVVDAAGGKRMAEAGANMLVDMTGQAVMGFWAALGHLRFYKRAMDRIVDHLVREKHDALVVVDAPSFHLRLARRVKKRLPHLPIIYYIAPKLWAWKEWRVKNLKRDIDKTLCIFPFEEKFFGDRGVDAVFVGNPTLDQVRRVSGDALTRVLHVEDVKRHNTPEKGVVAIFPGSRKSEIKYIWPLMTDTLALLRVRFPELKAAVAIAPGWSEERLAEYAPLPDNATFIDGESQELLDAASVVLAKSGTTTLEAAFLGKPMVVTYKGDAASFFIARKFVKLPYVSLPNIVAGKMLVREFLQNEATPENLAGEIGELLSNPKYYRTMRSKLKRLRDNFGQDTASDGAAREIAAFLK